MTKSPVKVEQPTFSTVMSNKDFGEFIQSMTNEEYWHFLNDISDIDTEAFTNKLLDLSEAELNTYFSHITSEYDVGKDEPLDIGKMSDEEYDTFSKSEIEKDDDVPSSENLDDLWDDDPVLEDEEEKE